eukprot:12701611-Alexandrium_andersonii.AAC.1
MQIVHTVLTYGHALLLEFVAQFKSISIALRQVRADEACKQLFAQAWHGCTEAGGRGPVSQLFGTFRALG